MKENHSASTPRSPSREKGDSLGKRFARLKKRIVKTLATELAAAVPPVRDHEFWTSILERELEKECPAEEFRRMSFKLRKAGDPAAAEEICARGIELHPSDLRLAVEHAEIARVSGDMETRIARWQRVADLGGNEAPVSAFKYLAECHRVRGDFSMAELMARRGLELYPCEFTLMEKLAVILSSGGRCAEAQAAWQAIIKAHPENDLAPAYLNISLALRDEGLLERAAQILHEGLDRYPDDSKIRDSLAELAALVKKPPKQADGNRPPATFTDHLFQDSLTPFGQGVLCFSTGSNALRQHVPAMLDFAETVAPPQETTPSEAIDVFAIWGVPAIQNEPIRELAAATRKPLLCLDSGFLSSPGIEGKDAPAHSVIICPDSIYFDATSPSHLETTLNSADYALTEARRIRAEACINSIVSHRLSKYNHAPSIDLRPRFPLDGTKRILLVDQRIGGGSIHWSLGGQGTFERMWETALAMPDHEILVKLHPEAISGRHRSQFRRLLPDPLPQNVTLIDFDVNPFDLFDIVDQVFVCTSQLGFEAAMAGKEVHCFGAPFYSGWGFTRDHIAVPRRKQRRSIAEVFHLFYIIHSRYFVPGQGGAEIEDLIRHFVACRDTPARTDVREEQEESPTTAAVTNEPLKILIVIPSGRYGASGRYLQNLSTSLIQLGCEVMILAEGPCQKIEAGVHWLTLDFDGMRLTNPIRREIAKFAPRIIYENGVRSRAQRAALEAMALTDARLVMQSEDDDIQVHHHRQSAKAAEHLIALDRPEISTAEISGFLRKHDWKRSLHIFLDPEFNRWIEPLLRILCYRMASLHTAIWHPFAERLACEYGVPTLVVPPVASPADFQRIPLTPDERERALNRHGVDPSRVVIFIGGTLYNYSPEFAAFLDALNLAAGQTVGKFALVVTSDRSSLPLERMARERLEKAVTFTDIGVAGDEVYMEMLKACDVVCSPGMPDTFNRFRLPSRLVKAMAMAKPILTCRCGFGESLQHNENAFLMDGTEPAAWADSIALCAESTNRTRVGNQGLLFAREHFDSDRVAATLKEQFESILAAPPRSLAAGITISPNDDSPHTDTATRPHPSIKFRNRFHSTLQFAIRALASRTHRIDTVVHIGAGKCGEFDDYCRLGARRIHLVEGSPGLSAELQKLANPDGTITIQQAVVSATGGIQPVYFRNVPADEAAGNEELSTLLPLPPFDRVPNMEISRQVPLATQTLTEICKCLPLGSDDHLLALETEGAEAELLASTSPELLREFRWIITRVAERRIFENAASGPALEQILTAAGFERIMMPPNHTDLMPAVLFERKSR